MAKRKRSNKSSKKKTTFKKRRGNNFVPRTPGGAIISEMKYFDTERALVAITASTDWTATEFDPNTTQEATPVATPLCLFAPKQGAGVNNRIGKSAKLFKIKIRGLINIVAQADQTGADSAALSRIILYQDMQTNIVQAQGEQVMTDPVTADAYVAINSFQNIDNFGRFRILKDKFISLMNPNMTYDGTNVEQQGLTKPFKITHTFKKPVEVRFNSTNGGTVADIVDNSFHVLATCTNATLVPNISYQARCSFKG